MFATLNDIKKFQVAMPADPTIILMFAESITIYAHLVPQSYRLKQV